MRLREVRWPDRGHTAQRLATWEEGPHGQLGECRRALPLPGTKRLVIDNGRARAMQLGGCWLGVRLRGKETGYLLRPGVRREMEWRTGPGNKLSPGDGSPHPWAPVSPAGNGVSDPPDLPPGAAARTQGRCLGGGGSGGCEQERAAVWGVGPARRRARVCDQRCPVRGGLGAPWVPRQVGQCVWTA